LGDSGTLVYSDSRGKGIPELKDKLVVLVGRKVYKDRVRGRGTGTGEGGETVGGDTGGPLWETSATLSPLNFVPTSPLT